MSTMKEEEDIDPTMVLSRETGDMLHMVYGSPPRLPIKGTIVNPVTSESIMQAAGIEVLKMQKKGFNCGVPLETSPSQVFNNLLTFKNRTTSVSVAGNKIVEVPEGCQQDRLFWHSTDTVQQAIKMIRSLPFKDEKLRNHAENRFRQLIDTEVIKMGHRGDLDTASLTRKRLMQVMKGFVSEVLKIRNHIIEKEITQDHIEKSSVSNEIISMFPACFTEEIVRTRNIPAPQKISDGPFNIADHVSNMSGLPEAYKLKSFIQRDTLVRQGSFIRKANSLVESFHGKGEPTLINVPKMSMTLGNVQVAKRSRRASSIPGRKQLFSAEYWKSTDPLANTRTGSSKTSVEQISDISSSIGFVVQKNEEVTEREPATDVKHEEEQEEEDTNEDVKETSVDTDKKPQYVRNKESSVVQYLLARNKILSEDAGGSQIHQRLNEIWAALGFTALQKIQMVVKYSQDTEESSRLSDALTAWENAHETVDRYLRAYSEVKNFVRYGISNATNTSKQMIFQELKADLQMCEKNVIIIADRLKSVYGDELIVRRRRALDIIASRRLKLKQMEIEFDIKDTE